eukprot:4966250-Amphidinium_carterae.1
MLEAINLAVTMLMVTKFQHPRMLDLAQVKADKSLHLLISPYEVQIRASQGAPAELDAEWQNADNGTMLYTKVKRMETAVRPADSIDGATKTDDNSDCYAIGWQLIPATPLTHVNAGPLVVDSKRMTMALDIAISGRETYEKSCEQVARSAMSLTTRLSAVAALALTEHSLYFTLCHERHLSVPLLEHVYCSAADEPPGEVVRNEELRGVIASFANLVHDRVAKEWTDGDGQTCDGDARPHG